MQLSSLRVEAPIGEVDDDAVDPIGPEAISFVPSIMPGVTDDIEDYSVTAMRFIPGGREALLRSASHVAYCGGNLRR